MEFAQLIAVSSVVMGASHFIARERLFAPLRERLGGKQTRLGYFVSCPYCVSHWVAFVLVPLTDAYFVQVTRLWAPLAWVLRWFLSSILVATVAAFLRVLFYLADESQGLVRRAEQLEEEELKRRK
jgi:hypothetical protein